MSPPPAAIEVEAVTDTTAVTISDPFTAPLKTNELYGRRRKTEKSQWGVAAPVNTANFQLQRHDLKPMAKRWDRKSSPVRGRRKMLALSLSNAQSSSSGDSNCCSSHSPRNPQDSTDMRAQRERETEKDRERQSERERERQSARERERAREKGKPRFPHNTR
jgi:hypothetical protein